MIERAEFQNSSGGVMYQLIPSPVEDTVQVVVRSARHTLFVVSPYIKLYGAKLILEHGHLESLKVLTNLSLGNVSGASYDVGALVSLGECFPVTVSSLGKLHAKVYVADNTIAFVTSANLTYGGLRENYEYGIVIRDTDIIHKLLTDLEQYFALGNIFDIPALEALNADVTRLRVLQKELRNTPAARKLRDALNEGEQRIKERLLQNRARGQTVNAIFAQTILYVLRTQGPLSTRELHPLVQAIHPDICDDTIDRVINGQHFGKKWKHMVRNAQQHLKAQGKIALIDGKWQLLEDG